MIPVIHFWNPLRIGDHKSDKRKLLKATTKEVLCRDIYWIAIWYSATLRSKHSFSSVAQTSRHNQWYFESSHVDNIHSKYSNSNDTIHYKIYTGINYTGCWGLTMEYKIQTKNKRKHKVQKSFWLFFLTIFSAIFIILCHPPPQIGPLAQSRCSCIWHCRHWSLLRRIPLLYERRLIFSIKGLQKIFLILFASTWAIGPSRAYQALTTNVKHFELDKARQWSDMGLIKKEGKCEKWNE